MIILYLFLFFLLPVNASLCQQNIEFTIHYNSNQYIIKTKEFNESQYFSLAEFCELLTLPYNVDKNYFNINFDNVSVKFVKANPYIVIRRNSDNKTKTIQLPVSSLLLGGEVYLPINYGLEIICNVWGKEIFFDSQQNVFINEMGKDIYFLSGLFDDTKPKEKIAEVYDITTLEKGEGVLVKIYSEERIESYKSFFKDGNLTVIFQNTQIKIPTENIKKTSSIKNISIQNNKDDSELTLDLNFIYRFSNISRGTGSNELLLRINIEPDPNEWFKVESENFIVIYRESNSFIVSHLIRSAESSLKVLMNLFNYTPSEKIVINTYDASDYGFGAATTVPQNYIRLEIEPLEPGYENTPYNDRFQWLLNHELVHIVVNDQASNIESISRTLFSKVAPEQVQPISVFYSLLTNFSRFTPRWHQEAMAVFLETWMSGGFGRILGNFDEMFFRTLVLDDKEFNDNVELETVATHNSFLLETLYYLYGARFAAYLSVNYGAQKLVDWFKVESSSFYSSYISRFKKVFGIDFDNAWYAFIRNEIQFQKRNIEKLKSENLTEVKRIKDETFGWTTQPHYDPSTESVLFGYHKPSHLSSIMKMNLFNLSTNDIATLPTPSQFQVASTAFDNETGLFFYTTNNNQLYRDVWVLDVESGEIKVLFKDSRIGHLSVSSKTHELWGVMHSGGKAIIVYSPYPYNRIDHIIEFLVGEEIQQLAVSPSGKYLALTLLKPDGSQSIILTDCKELLAGSEFKYENITSSGSPENPSWSSDEKFIFWNAYTNGVSNIFRKEVSNGNLNNSSSIALTHTLRGLFKPIHLSADLLFAFEFTTEGLRPVIIPNKPAGNLPAIEYYGQEVVKNNPEIYNWFVQPYYETSSLIIKEEKEYNGFNNLKILAFIPIISGFQKQKMLGFYTHIADPLLIHDFNIEAGYSPFNENPLGPKFHFKGKYEFMKRYELGVEYNAPDFYDLFNKRKRGLIGTKVKFGHTHYWIYDNPLKIKQQSEVSFYKDIEFLNDNLITVSEPDFLVAHTNINSKNLRRTVGSSDYEYGNEFNFTLRIFGAKPVKYIYAGQIYGEWDYYTTFLFPHNVFHLKAAAGYHKKNNDIFQARFFFGGFGNRALENIEVKQYRQVFRFPGVPIYSIDSESFLKVMIENNLPPLRFSNISIGQQLLSHIDFSIFTQAMYTESPIGKKWINVGGQLNFIFNHWFNLESTLSGGIANAWSENSKSWEWFVSFKLLRN